MSKMEEDQGSQVEDGQPILNDSLNDNNQFLLQSQSSEIVHIPEEQTEILNSNLMKNDSDLLQSQDQVLESLCFSSKSKSLATDSLESLPIDIQSCGAVSGQSERSLEDNNSDNKNVCQNKKRVNKSNENVVSDKRYRYSGYSMASTLQFLMNSSKETVDLVQEGNGESQQVSSEPTPYNPVPSETEASVSSETEAFIVSQTSYNCGQTEEKIENLVTDVKQDQVLSSHIVSFKFQVREKEEPLVVKQESIPDIKQDPLDNSLSSLVYSDDLGYDIHQTSVPLFHSEAEDDFRKSQCDNFLRGCKWSPDGLTIVTNSNDNKLRLYNFESATNSKLTSSLTMKEGSQIYDFAWLPQSSTIGPQQNKIVCTSSGIPAHLWNCRNGKVEASYKAFDQYDEVTAAKSICFSLDGSKVYAGYERTIRVFDTEYPNKYCNVVKTFDSKRKEGQTGIISCFAMSPDNNGLYVAGSYSRHIGIYDAACDKLVCLMQGQRGGVTHLLFSPDANKLYSGGRKDAEILCWDMRNTGKILFSVLRDVRTNQRIYFDISQSGKYLTSGNHDGSVTFWDTLSPNLEEINGEMFLKPCAQFQAHRDCVNGISFNHQQGVLATASGQRHFSSFHGYASDDSDIDVDEEEEQDFSLKLWTLPRHSHAMQ